MASPAIDRIDVALNQRVAQGDGAREIAQHVVVVWRQIEAALTPIIGQRGMATLYKRALYLARGHHPWLGSIKEELANSINVDALRAAFDAQPPVEAAHAGGALYRAFYELLSSLVGPALTAQLLVTVTLTPPPDAPQDTSP